MARIGRFDPLMRGKMIPANRVLPVKVAKPPDFLRNQAVFLAGAERFELSTRGFGGAVEAPAGAEVWAFVERAIAV